MTDCAVTGLVKRRAELTGEIERTHERLRQMVADLENLDATLHMFAPDMQIEAIRPKAFQPPKDWANRGERDRERRVHTARTDVASGTSWGIGRYSPGRRTRPSFATTAFANRAFASADRRSMNSSSWLGS